MEIQLTPEQRDFLVGLIDREMVDIGPEIHHTRTRDYREDLKGRRSLLAGLRHALTDEHRSVLAEPGEPDSFSAT